MTTWSARSPCGRQTLGRSAGEEGFRPRRGATGKSVRRQGAREGMEWPGRRQTTWPRPTGKSVPPGMSPRTSGSTAITSPSRAPRARSAGRASSVPRTSSSSSVRSCAPFAAEWRKTLDGSPPRGRPSASCSTTSLRAGARSTPRSPRATGSSLETAGAAPCRAARRCRISTTTISVSARRREGTVWRIGSPSVRSTICVGCTRGSCGAWGGRPTGCAGRWGSGPG